MYKRQRQTLTTAFLYKGPAAVRYPRGAGIGAPVEKTFDSLPIGKGKVLRNGKNIAILDFGTMVAPSLAAGESINATVVNMRFVKPIDKDLILEMAQTHHAPVSYTHLLPAMPFRHRLLSFCPT